MMSSVHGRRVLSAVLLGPLTLFLCGGPLASQAFAQANERKERLLALSKNQHIDPQLLMDPDGYARRTKAEASARRKAALAKLPKNEPAPWVKDERARVEEAQALHTLAGLGREIRQGEKPDFTHLSPAAQKLRNETKRTSARIGKHPRPPERMMQRMVAPARKPRSEAPKSWRDATARDLASAKGKTQDDKGKRGDAAPAAAPSEKPACKRSAKSACAALPAQLREQQGRKHARASQAAVPSSRVDSHAPAVPAPAVPPAADDEPLPVTPASLVPTLDAQSDNPLIVGKATELGHDPIRIYNFVHDAIVTELYAGSKKGAIGTLREQRGNDVDQASLLIALLRASGIPARYEVGNVAFTPAQANQYAGVDELSVAAGFLSSAGIPNSFLTLGPGQGVGLQVEHTWVRAQVPDTAYRGVTRPGASLSWVHLAPSIKQFAVHNTVDLRDAVTFDFAGYLSHQQPSSPLEVYEEQLRNFIRTSAVKCPTLDDAEKIRTIVPAELDLLPSELPVKRISTLAAYAEIPATERHSVKFTGQNSQGGTQLTYSAPMVSLWGKSVSMVYLPATTADATTIAQYGGLEQTPSYKVKLKATLEVDGVVVASGTAENPGFDQRLMIDLSSPATGVQRVEHPLIVGGVYAFALDPGIVPSDLLSERAARYPSLTGDDLEAEKLYVAALTYFHEYGRARDRIAGLNWHRIYKEVEEAAAMVVPRVEELNGVPLSISRDFFTFDAPGLRFGDFSTDGDQHRSVRLSQLIGYHSSVLEHLTGERFRGPKAFSAVKLLQVAHETSVPVLTFTQGNLDDALAQISWPTEREDRLRDFANRGFTLQAPVFGLNDPKLGQLYGFIATNPATGLGAYIVGSLRAETHGAECENDDSDTGEPGCQTCGETGSPVHLLSGNMPLTFTDLVLPARGIPLIFRREYNTRLGWTHNFRERLTPQSDGSFSWLDDRGISWRFASDVASGSWLPPPKLFQHIVSTAGGYEMRFKDGLVHRFDASGRLLHYEDLNGHRVTLQYDGSGRVAVVSGASGNAFSMSYDTLGRLASVSDSGGRAVSYAYSGPNIVSDVDVLGHTRSYGYDAFGRMHTYSDARGNLYRIDYDDVGRVVRLEDPLGGVDTYAYDFHNRRTMHVNRNGEPLLFELNALAKIIRRVDPLGNEQAVTYDLRGNKTSEADARGNLITMTYDADGDMLSHTDPAGAVTTFVYGANARLLQAKDAFLNTTTNTYDSHGNLLTSTDALGNVTSYTYTADGLPASITQAGSATTQMFYDTVGDMIATIDAEGGQSSMVYDSAGHVISATDADNATRTMSVDAEGKMLSMTDALAATTRFSYDADGNRTLVTDPDQRSTLFEYDALSRVVATTDPLGHVSRQEYDAEGHITAQVDPRGFRTELKYDAIGRVVQSCDPLGNCTSMAYCAELSNVTSDVVDALGNLTHVECDNLGREASRTDPIGNVSRTSYDLLGRRSSLKDPAGFTIGFGYDVLGRLTSVTDALQGATRYGYDARGNRTSVTDANNHVTLFDHDHADRLIAETTPINTVTQYAYDAAGLRRSKLDAKGQQTTFGYDDNHRLTTVGYQGGSSAAFDYDTRGHRVLEANQDSTRDFSYDALGRPQTVDDVETGRTLSYGYDASGNRTSMRVSPEDETTGYAWDARGLLTRMIDPEGGVYHFGYDDLGRRSSTNYPNGMTLQIVYDADSRVVSMVYRNAGGQILESFTYGYDSRGNRTAKALADGTAEQYGYDELSRLVRVAYPSGREVHYRYDAVGNRLEMTEGISGGPASTCAGDKDCDGLSDAMDNCPLISNATQTDGDALHPDAVSAWKFDEASGTTALDAVDSNPGTLTNGPTRVEPGKFGRSLGLNGTNAHVKINDAASLKPTTTLSMEAWVYLTRNNVSQVVVEKGDSNAGGYGMYVCQDGRPGYQFKVTGGVQSAASASALPLNQWHHLAATFDSGRTDRSKFYVDGVEVADSSAACLNVTNATGTLVQDTQPLEVGSRKGTSLFLQGQIDEVAVWSRALTGAEVTSHAQGLLFGDRLGDACDPCPSSASATCAPTTCLDQDGDGYGVQGSSACSGGLANFDCNDNDPAIHPGVVDSCDDVDNNCNGRKDEGCLAGAQTTTYQYNAFNQLVSLTGPVGTTTFTYDANGNQTSKVEPSGTTVFTYDARDRMVEVALPNGALGRFGYDTDNLRVRVEDSFGVRRLLLDGVDELSEYAVQAGRVARYDHDPSKVDALLAQLTAQGKVEAVSDALGSIYELTSGSGSALTRYAYDVYGARSASLEGVATKWGFTGRVREATFANAIYYRERELDTESGRWNAADPIGVADGVNRYAYVWGNSVLYVDPEGLRALIVTGIPEQIKLKKGGWYRPSPSQWGDLVKAALVGAGIVAADAIVRSVATSTDFKLIPVDMATSLKNEIDRIVVFTHFLNQCAPGDEGCGGPTTATRWAPGDALLPGTIASLVHQLQAYDVELIGCGGKSSSGQMKAIAKEVGVAIAYTASAVNYRVDMTGNDPATARMTITKFPGFATASPPAP